MTEVTDETKENISDNDGAPAAATTTTATTTTPSEEAAAATSTTTTTTTVEQSPPSSLNHSSGNSNSNDRTSISQQQQHQQQQQQQQQQQHRGLKILFLSSDTGGGHRASAESLGKQFEMLFPGSTYDLLDVVEKDGVPPYNSLVSYYKHLSAHPSQWKLVYSFSNSRAFEMLADAHLKLMCERAVRKSIQSYNPDVVISVHPLMTNVPVLSCSKIGNETGRHLPIFTVVTDLGSAHCLWFANGVEKMFVGSDQVKELAKVRGKVAEEKLVMAGLPIRHDFAVQAEKLGDRMSEAGQAYQKHVRQEELGLPVTDRKTILVMGGGEGVGSLSNIINALYVELYSQGIDALILVVCGRNQKLKNALDNRDWKEVVRRWTAAKHRAGLSAPIISMDDVCGSNLPTPGCMEGGTVTGSIRRMLSKGSLSIGNAMSMPFPDDEEGASSANAAAVVADAAASNPAVSNTATDEKKLQDDGEAAAATAAAEATAQLEQTILEASKDDANQDAGITPGNVKVVGLGFVTNMAEYMVAADILVTKAGPGTISEAAALSLPILLTSFLPGQEEGNVDFVVDGGFGAFCSDSDPMGVAEEVCMWLTDDEKRAQLSRAAKAKGAPHAARDIAKMIGDSTLKWIELNDEKTHATSPAH